MIHGERIRFRGMERADLPRFVEWVNDPAVRRGISSFLPISMAREELWFEDMLKLPIEEHPFAMEILDREKWVLAGSIGLMHIDWRSRKAEIGIMIGEKRFWNKGYGTEAMRLIMQHGFETLNLHRLYLRVFSDNPGAIRAYEKAGFVHEARMRETHFADGKYIDDLMMSMLRLEWNSAKRTSK